MAACLIADEFRSGSGPVLGRSRRARGRPATGSGRRAECRTAPSHPAVMRHARPGETLPCCVAGGDAGHQWRVPVHAVRRRGRRLRRPGEREGAPGLADGAAADGRAGGVAAAPHARAGRPAWRREGRPGRNLAALVGGSPRCHAGRRGPTTSPASLVQLAPVPPRLGTSGIVNFPSGGVVGSAAAAWHGPRETGQRGAPARAIAPAAAGGTFPPSLAAATGTTAAAATAPCPASRCRAAARPPAAP